jgi:hypothetical protein
MKRLKALENCLVNQIVNWTEVGGEDLYELAFFVFSIHRILELEDEMGQPKFLHVANDLKRAMRLHKSDLNRLLVFFGLESFEVQEMLSLPDGRSLAQLIENVNGL